jgi:hypothetical protein
MHGVFFSNVMQKKRYAKIAKIACFCIFSKAARSAYVGVLKDHWSSNWYNALNMEKTPRLADGSCSY